MCFLLIGNGASLLLAQIILGLPQSYLFFLIMQHAVLLLCGLMVLLFHRLARVCDTHIHPMQINFTGISDVES